MNWNELYSKEHQPDLSQIAGYVDTPLWEDLRAHLEMTYDVLPKAEHSTCSGAPGWNLKYKKGGRALCTLYPAHGYFTALVAIGRKEAMEAEFLLARCTHYLQELYWSAQTFQGGRWLMIEVTTSEILQDVKQLIALRAQK